jgi:hypothetical protein
MSHAGAIYSRLKLGCSVVLCQLDRLTAKAALARRKHKLIKGWYTPYSVKTQR